MTANIEKALEIVRSFTEAEFHSFISFMRQFQGVSTKHLNNYLVWYAWMQMNKELSEESLERNILNSSKSHNFRLYTSEISKKPVMPLAA